MKSVIQQNWGIFAVIVLVGVSLGLSFRTQPGACPLLTPVGIAGESEPIAGESEPIAGESEPIAGESEPIAGENEPIAGENEPAPRETTTTRGVIHADEASFQRLVLDADVPVLVDFYADWCGPCQLIAPELEKLSRETADAQIVKVDVDENPGLASRYGIRSIPNLLVFRNGEIVDQHVGFADVDDLRRLLGASSR